MDNTKWCSSNNDVFIDVCPEIREHGAELGFKLM